LDCCLVGYARQASSGSLEANELSLFLIHNGKLTEKDRNKRKINTATKTLKIGQKPNGNLLFFDNGRTIGIFINIS